MTGLLLPLAVDVIRVFFAVVVAAALLTIAGVIITHTTDVDAMADPTPRLDEVPGPYEHRGAYSSPNLPPDVPRAGSGLQRAQIVQFPDRSEWGKS